MDDWDEWKIFMTYTVLDELKGHPFLKGENRPLSADPYHEDWKNGMITGRRQRSSKCRSHLCLLWVGEVWYRRKYTLLMVSRCWTQRTLVAARLKMLRVSNLIIYLN